MNRRRFLQSSAALGAMPILPRFLGPAHAADVSGYKALVVVFLFGGNDSQNMIVPITPAEYNGYSTARGGLAEANGLALPQAALLPLSGGAYGLHPAMTGLASMYNADQKLAVVANTGVLLAPTTLAQYKAKSVPLPPALFSHSDMQSHWQTMRPDQPADTGWGGRLADVFRFGTTGSVPPSIGLGGGGIFMKGDQVFSYQVSPMKYKNTAIDNTFRIARPPRADIYWNWTGSNPQTVFETNARLPRANLIEEQYATVTESAIDMGQFVSTALYNETTVNGNTTYALKSPVPGAWPATNRLAAQLHTVAAMIAARQALGVTRQVFFVSLGGFDNHGDQFGRTAGTDNKTLLAGKHYDLLRSLDQALRVFYDATVAMGVASNVTTMTLSDFGRTLKSNGQGSDHGWGGHHLVMGGAVKGGRIVGTMPTVALNTATDVGEGRLLPTTATETYAASCAQWMGATSGELDVIFPNLGRFPTRTLDLFV
jgi:uncharacterized protein (DUF1501 family)